MMEISSKKHREEGTDDRKENYYGKIRKEGLEKKERTEKLREGEKGWKVREKTKKTQETFWESCDVEGFGSLRM